VCLRKDVEALFVRLWLPVETGKAHEAEAEAVDLGTIATQLSRWKRHVVCFVSARCIEVALMERNTKLEFLSRVDSSTARIYVR
jgi:hypothetical protein